MELDVATLNGPVLIFEPCVIHVRDGRRVEELDGKLVSAPTRFHDVVDFNAVRKATRTIDLRGPRDYPVIGPIQPLKVAGHARAMHLNRRIRAVIVVLEVTPEGAVLDAASNSEIRLGTSRQGGRRRTRTDDEATARHEVTGDFISAWTGYARAHRMAGDDQEAYRHDVNDAAHGSDEARRGPHQIPAVAEAMTTSAIPSTMT